jgi:adenylosuccinate synthase
MADLRNPEALKEKLRKIVSYKNKLFSALYNADPLRTEEVYEKCLSYRQALEPFIANTTQLLFEAIQSGKNILFEGAQGALLDLDHGTFPYVTSSNASALGLGPGSGVPACHVHSFIGVVKAYMTRVGSGPFPAEQDNEIGQRIREKGHEYGTTTGRPRRCGWFDAVAVAYTVRLGGITEVAMMHLDTLAGLDEVNICRAYRIRGREVNFFPGNQDDLASAECIYETLPGWHEDLSKIQRPEDLPANVIRYIQTAESLIGAPITMIGVGPKRSQVIYRKPV